MELEPELEPLDCARPFAPHHQNFRLFTVKISW